jgi:hypothetical protein
MMANFADLISERSRRLLAEQLAALAAEEAAKPPAIPAALFQAPPDPQDTDD